MEPGRLEAGCDEAGRGPLAGPVYAAAVILPPDFFHPLLDDSKKMSEKAREELRPVIEREALAWAVEAVSAEEIDRLNILGASLEGMRRAVRKLAVRPDFLLIDGNRFRPFDGYPYRTVVHGDATYASIAAASVLAKTFTVNSFNCSSSAEPTYSPFSFVEPVVVSVPGRMLPKSPPPVSILRGFKPSIYMIRRMMTMVPHPQPPFPPSNWPRILPPPPPRMLPPRLPRPPPSPPLELLPRRSSTF